MRRMVKKMRLLVELDKAGAEWVCVAYLSGDENMLSVIASGKNPHAITGAFISHAPYEFVLEESKVVGLHTDPDTLLELREALTDKIEPGWFLPRSMSIYQCGKKSDHGLNYNMKYRRFALENEVEESEAKRIVDGYHRDAYPGIKKWHQAEQEQLRIDRTLTNCFGRKRRFMGAWDDDLFDAAYAFKPQSTVYDITRFGMVKTFSDESKDFEIQETPAQVW